MRRSCLQPSAVPSPATCTRWLGTGGPRSTTTATGELVPRSPGTRPRENRSVPRRTCASRSCGRKGPVSIELRPRPARRPLAGPARHSHSPQPESPHRPAEMLVGRPFRGRTPSPPHRQSRPLRTTGPQTQATLKTTWAQQRRQAGAPDERTRHQQWLTSMTPTELAARSTQRAQLWRSRPTHEQHALVQDWDAHRIQWGLPASNAAITPYAAGIYSKTSTPNTPTPAACSCGCPSPFLPRGSSGALAHRHLAPSTTRGPAMLERLPPLSNADGLRANVWSHWQNARRALVESGVRLSPQVPPTNQHAQPRTIAPEAPRAPRFPAITPAAPQHVTAHGTTRVSPWP